MGSGASAPISAHMGLGSPKKRKEPADAMVAFTSLEAEMGKPVDASDLCTPRGTPQIDLARTEVQRLRRLIKSGRKRMECAITDQDDSRSEAATNMLLYGQEVHPHDTQVEEERVHHIDDFAERRLRKKEMNKKMRKLKIKTPGSEWKFDRANAAFQI